MVDMISSNTFPRGGNYSPERWEVLIQVQFRSRTLSSSITGFWSESSELSVTSPFRVGEGWGSCIISNEEMLSEAQEKHFYHQLDKSPFRGNIFFLLKPSSKHYFLISSKSIVTDVGQNMLPPSEVLISMVRISFILWPSFMLCVCLVLCFFLFFFSFPLRKKDL